MEMALFDATQSLRADNLFHCLAAGKTSDAVHNLQQLEKLADTNDNNSLLNFVQDFVALSPQPTSLLQLIDNGGSVWKSGELRAILRCLELFLLTINKDLPQHNDFARAVAEALVNPGKVDVVVAFLKNAKHKASPVKVCLRLLSTICSTPGSHAKQVLANFPFDSLFTLVDHRDSRDNNDVRHHLVLFVASVLLHTPLSTLVEYQKVVPSFVQLIDKIFLGLTLDHAATVQIFLGVLSEKFLSSYPLQRRRTHSEHAADKSSDDLLSKKKPLNLPVTHRDLYRHLFSLNHLSAVAQLMSRWTGPKKSLTNVTAENAESNTIQNDAESDAIRLAADHSAVVAASANLLKQFFVSQAHPWIATTDLTVMTAVSPTDARNNSFHLTEFLCKHFADIPKKQTVDSNDDDVLALRRQVLALILSRYPDQILFFLRSVLSTARNNVPDASNSSNGDEKAAAANFIDDSMLLSVLNLLGQLDIDLHYIVGRTTSLPKALNIILFCALPPIVTLDLQTSALRRQRSIETVVYVINFLYAGLKKLDAGLIMLKSMLLSDANRKVLDDFITTKAAHRFVSMETVAKTVQHHHTDSEAGHSSLLYPFLRFLQLYSKIFNQGRLLLLTSSSLNAFYLATVGLSQLDFNRILFSTKSRRKKAEEIQKLADLVEVLRQCSQLEGSEVQLRGQLVQRDNETFVWTTFSPPSGNSDALVSNLDQSLNVTGMLPFLLRIYCTMLQIVTVAGSQDEQMTFSLYCQQLREVQMYTQRWNKLTSVRFAHTTRQIPLLVTALENLFVRMFAGLGAQPPQLTLMLRLFAFYSCTANSAAVIDIIVERFWKNAILHTIVKRAGQKSTTTNFFLATLAKHLFFDEKSRQEKSIDEIDPEQQHQLTGKFESEILWLMLSETFLPSNDKNKTETEPTGFSQSGKKRPVHADDHDEGIRKSARSSDGNSVNAAAQTALPADTDKNDADASKTLYHIPNFCLKTWCSDNFEDTNTHRLIGLLYRLSNNIPQKNHSKTDFSWVAIQLLLSAEQMFYFVCRHERFAEFFDQKQQQQQQEPDNIFMQTDADEPDQQKPASTTLTNSENLKIAVLDLLILLDRCTEGGSALNFDNESGQKILDLLCSNYSATQSPCDVRILALLTRYYAAESRNESTNDFACNIPILPKQLYTEWSSAEKKQQVTLKDFLGCFQPDIMLATARTFPLYLPMDTSLVPSQMPPNINFSFAADKSVTASHYDTRYLLLCFAALLAPAAVQQPVLPSTDSATRTDSNRSLQKPQAKTQHLPIMQFVTSHALRLILCSLASVDVGTRSLGYYCLQSFTTVCRARKFHGKQQLLAILSGLQRSLWKPHVRLSSLWTMFIGRACELVFAPQERIFRNIADELFQHDTFELRSVPGFTRFVLSNSIGSTSTGGGASPLHRQELGFLLSNVLTHGVRTVLDVDLLNRYGSWHILQALALAQPALVGETRNMQNNVRQIMLRAVQVLQPNKQTTGSRNFLNENSSSVEQLRTLSVLWKDYGLLQFAVSTLFVHDSSDGASGGGTPLNRLLDQTPERSLQELLDAAMLVHLMFDASRARIVMLTRVGATGAADAEKKSSYRIIWQQRPPVFACAAMLSALECTLYAWCKRILCTNLLSPGDSTMMDSDDDGETLAVDHDDSNALLDEKVAYLSLQLILDVGACHDQFDLPFEWNLWDNCFSILKRILTSNWFWRQVKQAKSIADDENNRVDDFREAKQNERVDRLLDAIILDVAYWQKGATLLSTGHNQSDNSQGNSLYKFKTERTKWLVSVVRQAYGLLFTRESRRTNNNFSSMKTVT